MQTIAIITGLCMTSLLLSMTDHQWYSTVSRGHCQASDKLSKLIRITGASAAAALAMVTQHEGAYALDMVQLKAIGMPCPLASTLSF